MSKIDEDRNPFIVPESETHTGRCCPVCKGTEFGGRKVQGLLKFTCRNPDCRNEWQGGGLGMEPLDPLKPRPHEPEPLVGFYKNPVTKKIEESRRSPTSVPSFRRGSLIPKDDE